MARNVVETRRDRMALAHDAGVGSLSFVSVLAGAMVAFGSFVVIAAIVGAVLAALGVDSARDLGGDWRDVGVGAGIAGGVTMMLAYLFGGYVAGRMARRAGALNGLMVFVLGLLVGAGIGAVVGAMGDADMVRDNLSSIGFPSAADDWAGVGAVAGIASLTGMLLGSVIGGIAGERWHGKLVTHAREATADGAATDGLDLRDRGSAVADGTRDGDGAHFADRSTTLDEDLARAKH